MASSLVLSKPTVSLCAPATTVAAALTTRSALAEPTLSCSTSTHLAPSFSIHPPATRAGLGRDLLAADVLPTHAALAATALFAEAAHAHLGHAGGALLTALHFAATLACALTGALRPALDEPTSTISATCHGSCHPPLAGFSNAAWARLSRWGEVHLVRINRLPLDIDWLSVVRHVVASYFLRRFLVNERLRA